MLFCKHEWKVLSETCTESKFQHAIKQIGSTSGDVKIPHQMSHADRKYIQILTCNKCGKLKRFVEEI